MAYRRVEDFLKSFVFPLVAGGRIQIERPVDIKDIENFELHLPEASVECETVDRARTRVISTLVLSPPPLVFDTEDLRLAAAVHNLLFLCHPRTESWTVSNRALARVLENARYFADQPMVRDRRRILGRHGLLHNLFDLHRSDIEVKWWSGSARFVGQVPPWRLLRWGKLRRVKKKEIKADLQVLLENTDSKQMFYKILRRTPLSNLLCRDTERGQRIDGSEGWSISWPLNWEECVFVLRDSELARAICYESVHSFTHSGDVSFIRRFSAALG